MVAGKEELLTVGICTRWRRRTRGGGGSGWCGGCVRLQQVENKLIPDHTCMVTHISILSLWYNCTAWLGIKHQFTLPLSLSLSLSLSQSNYFLSPNWLSLLLSISWSSSLTLPLPFSQRRTALSLSLTFFSIFSFYIYEWYIFASTIIIELYSVNM